MTHYLLRRLLLMVPTLFGVTVVVFTFIHLLPGDPAALMAGSDATGEAVSNMRHELGLDKPVWIQYGIYVRDLLHGNLGASLRDHSPVSAHIGRAFGPTLVLTACAMAVAVTVGLTIGVVAAVYHNKFPDYAGTSLAMFGISLPSFVLGLALIWIFAVDLRWFPTGGYNGPATLVLPAITLGMGAGAAIERIARSQMLEALGQDYVRTAKAKGQRPRAIVVRHVLRNALIPVVTVAGLDFGYLISGAIIVESIFAYPGIGRLLVDSIAFRDYPQIQGIVFIFAAEFLIVNLLTDLLYARVDPPHPVPLMRLPRFMTALRRSASGGAGAVLVALVAAGACFGPVVAPYAPNAPNYAHAQEAPTLDHWGGTDEFGRDVLSRVLYGARISLGVAVLGVAGGLLPGIGLGLVTGYFRGRLDDVVMRAIDVLLAFPGILLAIAMVAILGPGLQNIVMAIAFFSLPGFTRLVRGSTLQVSGLDYIEAVRAQGARSSWILLRHILPNIIAPLIVIATLRLGAAILTESALAFLGLGAPPPTPEWGAILSDAKDNLVTSPYLAIAPGIALVVTVLGFNLLGDGLRDALDPRLRT